MSFFFIAPTHTLYDKVTNEETRRALVKKMAAPLVTLLSAESEIQYGRGKAQFSASLRQLKTRMTICIGRWTFPDWFPDRMLRKNMCVTC